jgi:hypothetical protein
VQGERKRVIEVKTRIFGCLTCGSHLQQITTNFMGSNEVIAGILNYHNQHCKSNIVYQDKKMVLILGEDMWQSIEDEDWLELTW